MLIYLIKSIDFLYDAAFKIWHKKLENKRNIFGNENIFNM